MDGSVLLEAGIFIVSVAISHGVIKSKVDSQTRLIDNVEKELGHLSDKLSQTRETYLTRDQFELRLCQLQDVLDESVKQLRSDIKELSAMLSKR